MEFRSFLLCWMTTEIWHHYLRNVLKPEITGPSVLLLDNLDCHVSQAAEEIVATELFSSLCALPPNTTSICQPLDVGVMGPLKAKLRSLWLEECSFEHVSAAEKRVRMITRTIKVWDEISKETVRASFSKALPTATV
jgi:hypothetical protein